MSNTHRAVGGWIKAVLMQELTFATVAQCCEAATAVEEGVAIRQPVANVLVSMRGARACRQQFPQMEVWIAELEAALQ